MAGRLPSPRVPPAPTQQPDPLPVAAAEPAVAPNSKSVAARAAAVRARADDARRRLEEQRPNNRIIDVGFRSIQLDNEAGGVLLAGAIAFRFFLFLVPAAFVLVVGLGLGAESTGTDVNELAKQAGIAGIAATAIQSSSDASKLTQIVTLCVALVTLVFGSRNLVKSLILAQALIWRQPREKLRHPTRTGIVFIGVFAVALVLLTLVDKLRGLSFAGWVVGIVLFTLVPAGGWLLCSVRVFPSAPGTSWSTLWPGALLFGVGVQALHVATVVWLTRSLESKSETYGAIGAALTMLFWSYLLGRIVTSAAALNAALWRSSARTPTQPPAPAA